MGSCGNAAESTLLENDGLDHANNNLGNGHTERDDQITFKRDVAGMNSVKGECGGRSGERRKKKNSGEEGERKLEKFLSTASGGRAACTFSRGIGRSSSCLLDRTFLPSVL